MLGIKSRIKDGKMKNSVKNKDDSHKSESTSIRKCDFKTKSLFLGASSPPVGRSKVTLTVKAHPLFKI